MYLFFNAQNIEIQNIENLLQCRMGGFILTGGQPLIYERFHLYLRTSIVSKMEPPKFRSLYIFMNNSAHLRSFLILQTVVLEVTRLLDTKAKVSPKIFQTIKLQRYFDTK